MLFNILDFLPFAEFAEKAFAEVTRSDSHTRLASISGYRFYVTLVFHFVNPQIIRNSVVESRVYNCACLAVKLPILT